MSLVQYQQTKEFGTITLHDPDNLNAMSETMALEFKTLISTIKAATEQPRTLILTGAGRAFSAGGRLEMLEKKRTLTTEENKKMMMDFYHSFLQIRSLHIPLIAAINGHAIGAGLCLACACDIRIAAQNAKLGATFVRLGLHPGMGATYFLPKILGVSLATELLISGRVLEAEEAERLGLVSKVAPVDQLMIEAKKTALEIAAAGPAVIKQLLHTLRDDPSTLESALLREAECQSVNYASAEFAEGVRAAMEKRTPKF